MEIGVKLKVGVGVIVAVVGKTWMRRGCECKGRR